MKKKYYVTYILAIIWFMLITIKIFFVRQTFGKFTIAVVHYGLGLLIFLSVHYVWSEKRELLKIILMRGLQFVGSILGALAVSTVGCMIIFRDMGLLKLLYRIAFSAFILLAVEIIVLYIMKKIKFDSMFGLLLLCIGTMMALLFPIKSGISWDDQIHFQRAIYLSNGCSYQYSEADGMMVYNAYVPFEEPIHKKYKKFIKNINTIYEKNKKAIMSDRPVPKSSIIAYAPAAMGILIGKGLALPYLLIFILGRWMNAMTYALVLYFAVKQLKTGKLLLAAYAFYPTNMLLAASYSYDYWIISLSILSICKFIGIMQDPMKKISLKDMLIIFVTMTVALLPKPTYFPMFLFFIMGNIKEKVENEKERKCYYTLLCISIIFTVCWFVIPYLVAGAGGNDIRGGTDVNSKEQIAFILSHPLQYANILLKFLKEYWSYGSSAEYISYWAYLGLVPYHLVNFILIIIVMLIDKDEIDRRLTGIKQKVFWCMIAFGISAINATSLYVAFTPVASEVVTGCQARYLLPIIFPTVYILGSYVIAKPFRRINHTLAAGVVVAVNMFILFNGMWRLSIVPWIG